MVDTHIKKRMPKIDRLLVDRYIGKIKVDNCIDRKVDGWIDN